MIKYNKDLVSEGQLLANLYQEVSRETFFLHLNRAPTMELVRICDAIIAYSNTSFVESHAPTLQKVVQALRLVKNLLEARVAAAKLIKAAQAQREYAVYLVTFEQSNGKPDACKVQIPIVEGWSDTSLALAAEGKFRKDFPGCKFVSATRVN